MKDQYPPALPLPVVLPGLFRTARSAVLWLGGVLLLLPMAAESAAVRGRIANRTTGRAAEASSLQLVRQAPDGWEEIVRIDQPSSDFSFQDLFPGDTYKIIVEFQNRTFSRQIRPVTGETLFLTIPVFEITDSDVELHLQVDFLFFGHQEGALFVRKRIEAENPGREAIEGIESRLRVALPISPAPADLLATLTIGQASRDVQLVPAGGPGEYAVDALLLPGISKLDLEFKMPFSGHAPFEQVFLFDTPSFQVFTYPLTLFAESSEIEPLGIDHQLEAIRYRTQTGFAAGERLLVMLIPTKEEMVKQSEWLSSSVEIEQIPPWLSRWQWITIPWMTLLLLAGATVAGRKRSKEISISGPSVGDAERILNEALHNLELQHQAGLLNREEFETRRMELEAKLRSVASAHQSQYDRNP